MPFTINREHGHAIQPGVTLIHEQEVIARAAVDIIVTPLAIDAIVAAVTQQPIGRTAPVIEQRHDTRGPARLTPGECDAVAAVLLEAVAEVMGPVRAYGT